jgi:hypothetical protein
LLDNTKSTTTTEDERCGDQAYVYVQVACIIPQDKQKERRIFGLLVGCIGVFISLFSMVYYDYIKTVQSTLYVDWDVKTITAGDYSIEFDIEQDTYDYWLEHYFDKNNAMSENAQFKLYCQNEIEERTTAMENLGFDDDEEHPNGPESIKIAQVTFAYNNAQVIRWLT